MLRIRSNFFSDPDVNILWQLKIKKIILTKLYFKQFYITRKLFLKGSLCGSGSGFFPDPGYPKRPNLPGFGSATLKKPLKLKMRNIKRGNATAKNCSVQKKNPPPISSFLFWSAKSFYKYDFYTLIGKYRSKLVKIVFKFYFAAHAKFCT